MTTVPGFDTVQTFQIEHSDIRGRLVRLHDVVDALRARHDYPPLVAARLAEGAALAAVLASSLKYDGTFSLQIQGDGPLGLILIDLGSDGAMRGYARFDADAIAALDEPAPEMPRLLGAGHMVFTIDQGADTDRYQGVTALTGKDLSTAAREYFQQSEQIPTEIALFSSTDADGSLRAGALMIQKMPAHGGARPHDTDDRLDSWQDAVLKLRSMRDDEFLSPALSPETLTYRLYHEEGVRVFTPKALFHRCRCSREKVAATLKSFPREEIIDAHGSAHVVCEFCKQGYSFDSRALDDLYENAKRDSAP